jgi:hypothetical protein
MPADSLSMQGDSGIGPLQSVIEICDPQTELPPFVRLQNLEELVERYFLPIDEDRCEPDRAKSDIVAEATSPVLRREIAGSKTLTDALAETAKRQVGACFGMRRKTIASSVPVRTSLHLQERATFTAHADAPLERAPRTLNGWAIS